MKRILFVSPTLGNGGAERIMLYLMNYFSVRSDKYEVSLLLIKNEGSDYLTDLSDKIKVYRLRLDNRRIRNCIPTVIKSIIIIRPTICFIGLFDLNIALAFFLPVMKMFKIHFIVRETNIISRKYHKNKLLRLGYRLFYNLYDRIIAQSKDMQEDLIENWSINPKRVRLINNPIPIESVQERSLNSCPIQMDSNQYNFVIIGKFSPQKGYDILLKRLSELPRENQYHLYVLGSGKLQLQIEEWIVEYGLKDYVTLLGFHSNPYPYIKAADSLVLSSRYEGFPNVLLEANALGKPVFVNYCKGGINEIVVNGVNGTIADFTSPEEFKKAYDRHLNTNFDEKIIKQMTSERYSCKNILPVYESVINSVR